MKDGSLRMKSPRVEQTKSHRRRGGVILVAVLLSLAIAAAILLSMVTAAAARRTAAGVAVWRVQAALLAESAFERAAARLAADAAYRGETWKIPQDPSIGWQDAVVVIRVELVPDQPQSRQVFVCADYPGHPSDRARREINRMVRCKS